jgi:hypothetical protein
MNEEAAVVRRPAVSAFGQTGHWSRHGTRTAFDDPKETFAFAFCGGAQHIWSVLSYAHSTGRKVHEAA